jgi:hypothetical protein
MMSNCPANIDLPTTVASALLGVVTGPLSDYAGQHGRLPDEIVVEMCENARVGVDLSAYKLKNAEAASLHQRCLWLNCDPFLKEKIRKKEEEKEAAQEEEQKEGKDDVKIVRRLTHCSRVLRWPRIVAAGNA